MPDYSIAAPARISPDVFHQVLQRAQSPATVENMDGALYRICVSVGVDPAVALAFFCHESSYGRQGRAVTTLNWGNLRFGRRQLRQEGGFAVYRCWADSLADFCALLRGPLYEGEGLRTIAAIVPKYAPSSDGNKPASYIGRVTGLVEAWAKASQIAGWQPAVEAIWAPWGTAFPLPVEQRGYAIPLAWADAPWLGAAESEEVTRGPSGRRVAWRLFAGGWICWEESGNRVTLYRRVGVTP